MGLDWDKIRADYAKRATPEELGTVPQQPKNLTDRFGGKHHTGTEPRYDRVRMVSLYQQGWSVPKIAAEVGCDRQTVYTALKANNVKMRDDRKALPGAPRKDTCRNGHKRTKENTRVNKKGARRCRECDHNNYLKRKMKS